jgi:hypothetical protein
MAVKKQSRDSKVPELQHGQETDFLVDVRGERKGDEIMALTTNKDCQIFTNQYPIRIVTTPTEQNPIRHSSKFIPPGSLSPRRLAYTKKHTQTPGTLTGADRR